jgi:hypothetical protein
MAAPGHGLQYAPAFRGGCIVTVGHGCTADVDPQACRSVDGRVSLDYPRSSQRRWERDIPGHLVGGRVSRPAVPGR